jgi:galactose-1-phosphate uridylyltransferase
MHSLMDVKHSSPHAEIEFADPYDPVTEANILNMHREKRATSHENENVETPKQGCKLIQGNVSSTPCLSPWIFPVLEISAVIWDLLARSHQSCLFWQCQRHHQWYQSLCITQI